MWGGGGDEVLPFLSTWVANTHRQKFKSTRPLNDLNISLSLIIEKLSSPFGIKDYTYSDAIFRLAGRARVAVEGV